MSRRPSDLELSAGAKSTLEDVHPHAVAKYNVYRRRGLLPGDAYRAALAWGRNSVEQRERRVSHGTGATL